MITNLFSVFDPSTGMLSINWIRIILFIFFIPIKFWIRLNKYNIICNLLINTLYKEILSLIKFKGTILIIMSIFSFILINNIAGLLPYIFTATSHLITSIALALPIWIALIIFGWYKKTNHIFSHLLPNGTPGILIPFIVIIETIRNFIRPGSLSVRLTANIIAGHLLMSLLGRDSSIITIVILIIVFITLILFEFAVGIIQSYVFITLSTLYSREI